MPAIEPAAIVMVELAAELQVVSSKNKSPAMLQLLIKMPVVWDDAVPPLHKSAELCATNVGASEANYIVASAV